ncbi:receptor-like protein EIX2 [Hevea brasiliensis]|uniref:receptor-like protein EIX2 n=1 Tax=Hevea brasiliensis TaxID=3981 RepID=UPI0025E0BB4D|nr:receptor-like protein EIX2 [Hevea brasiliensis]
MAEKEVELHQDYTKDELKILMWEESQGINGLFRFRKIVDFSYNMLSREIPREVTTLIILKDLNLLNNYLTRSIPCDIRAMKSLYSLDLFGNHLSGIIPPSISDLTNLNTLNLSYNNLSAKVTSCNNFSASAFTGNHNLYSPLFVRNCFANESFEETECSTDRKSKGQNDGIQVKEHRRGFEEKPSFYIIMASGFVIGFWGL